MHGIFCLVGKRKIRFGRQRHSSQKFRRSELNGGPMEASFSGRHALRRCSAQGPYNSSSNCRKHTHLPHPVRAIFIRTCRIGSIGHCPLGLSSASTAILQSEGAFTGKTLCNKGRQAAKRQGRVRALQVKALAEVVDVEEVGGVKVVLDEKNRPIAQYLVKWKDGQPPTW